MSYLITGNQLPAFNPAETDSVIITLNILPPASADPFQEMYPRLTVGMTEVALRSASWRETEDGLSTELNFQLWDIEDRSLIVPGASLKFEVGTVAASQTTPTYITVADLAAISQDDFQIAGDAFAFSVRSGITEKLNLTPTESLVIYDPVRVPFDASEVETIKDTIGREYGVEDFSVNDLTLYDVLTEIIVNRAGFTAYKTNIPDHPVRRADVEVGTPFINGIAPLLGAFEPVLFEDTATNTLWILSTLQDLPTGFPAPRDLSGFRCEDAVVSSQYQNVDYAEMVYSVPDVFDYYTTRRETATTDNGGSLVAGTLVITVLSKTIAEFRNLNAPDLILKEETKREIRETYKGVVAGSPFHYERLDNTFDSFGRLKTSTTARKETLPDPSTASDLVYIDSENVQTNIRYAQHPRILARQYQKSLTRLTESLIIEDDANPYEYSSDTKFRQKLSLAHRTGNVIEGQAVALVPTSSYEERARVLANGLVEQVITEADLIADTLHVSITEPRVADISVNGSQSTGRRMLVFDPENAAITTGKKLTVAVGDMPIELAKAITTRKLRRAKAGAKQASLAMRGIDLSIRRGSLFQVKNKALGVEGSFICTSFAGQFTATENGNEFRMTIGGLEI